MSTSRTQASLDGLATTGMNDGPELGVLRHLRGRIKRSSSSRRTRTVAPLSG